VARKRWEDWGKMTEAEREAYDEAAGPIKATAGGEGMEEEANAARSVAHKVGMRAVEERWERRYDEARAPSQGPPRQPQPQPQQQQRPQQQQGRQQPATSTAQPGRQQPSEKSNWVQRAAAAAALPQTAGREFKRIGRNGKLERDPSGLEPIKRALPWDERAILFERAVGAPQVDPGTAANVAAQVNIALSRVAPPHICTEAVKISAQGRLTTTARSGASAAMLLHFKKDLIEAARRADKAIINVVANETWAELKILVPYGQYWHASGLSDLRERIEAENEGVIVPPCSMRWMRSKKVVEQLHQQKI